MNGFRVEIYIFGNVGQDIKQKLAVNESNEFITSTVQVKNTRKKIKEGSFWWYIVFVTNKEFYHTYSDCAVEYFRITAIFAGHIFVL